MSALLEAAPNDCRKTSPYFKCRSMNATLKTCGIKGNFLQIWVLCRSGSGLESLSSLPVKQCSKQCLFFHFLQQFSAWSLFTASGELLNQTLTRTFLREKGEPSVPENYFHNNFINYQGNLFFFVTFITCSLCEYKIFEVMAGAFKKCLEYPHYELLTAQRDGTGSLLAHISQGIFNGRSVRRKLNSQALNPNKKPWLFIFLVK